MMGKASRRGVAAVELALLLPIALVLLLALVDLARMARLSGQARAVVFTTAAALSGAADTGDGEIDAHLDAALATLVEGNSEEGGLASAARLAASGSGPADVVWYRSRALAGAPPEDCLESHETAVLPQGAAGFIAVEVAVRIPTLVLHLFEGLADAACGSAHAVAFIGVEGP